MLWLLAVVLGASVVAALAYHAAPLWLWTALGAALLLLLAVFTTMPVEAQIVLWALFGLAALLLNVKPVRRRLLARPLLAAYRRVLPRMSRTEREAVAAGTVWWDRELFAGKPDWQRLLATPPPQLSDEERAFVDGPVEELCGMLDDWEITHERQDLSPEAWEFIRANGFFGMIIPKRYGGLGFSALAHSTVVMKITSRSVSAAVTVMVPNSLGPAELLLDYGTEEQKDYYLPRLASGEEIPCFALTSPEAGSDAGAIPDIGRVCRGTWRGERDVLGIRLNWDKRYITLGPVATLLGLAFKLHDPEHLLGTQEHPGITIALIPTDTPGIKIGNRHLPMNQAFMNGPTQGEDVFIPVDAIIGGRRMAGQGWRMLMESLAAGRSISLPALSTGSAKIASRVTGAYAGIRRQFKTPVGQFEGVQEALARIGGNTYLMDAARTMTAAAVDQGEKPSVISAIVKYHLTERMRQVLNDAMDVHGGRAICLGPRNYLGAGYQGVPIAITVEGANILTRSLIIFGQGAIRCHPYLLEEIQAASEEDSEQGLAAFDEAIFAHVGFSLSNVVRCMVLAVSGARLARTPGRGSIAYYYRQLTRMSASLALVADVVMALFGGKLKRLERLSARLGDVLSYLYLGCAALKRFEDQGCPDSDRPLLHWACRDALYRIQTAFDELFRNLPSRWIARMLRLLVFPFGLPYTTPNDANDRRVARLLLKPSPARDRLTEGIYVGGPHHATGRVEDALAKAAVAEPVTRKVQRAVRSGKLEADTPDAQIEEALHKAIISPTEAALLRTAEDARREAIQVDDFPPESFGRRVRSPEPEAPANAKPTQAAR